MTRTMFALFGMGLASAAAAQPASEPDAYFSRSNVTLSATEQRGLAITDQFLNDSSSAIQPMPAPGGAVSFVFGVTAPSIVCAVLQVCDIELQPGEQINSVNLGDTARWLIEPAVSGSGAGEVQHLIVKPLDVGLETNLVVTTDRRTYHMRLRSHRSQYMARIVFLYPDDANAKLRAFTRRAELLRVSAAQSGPAHQADYASRLDFNYSIEGRAPWKPVRVFNDGVKTIVEMPTIMQQTEAPSLLVVRRDGSPRDDKDKILVNYRLQDNRYIVDQVFDRAVLIAGVGRRQDRVVITRR